MPVLRHAPCGFGRGTARRIEKKRDRVAHHQSHCARALWRPGQLVDEETVGLLALNRFFRDANDAGDIVLRRLQLDCRGARDHIVRWLQPLPSGLLSPAENPDLGRDRLGPIVTQRDRRRRARRHDLQKDGSDLQGRGRGAACGEPGGEQKDAEGARYFSGRRDRDLDVESS